MPSGVVRLETAAAGSVTASRLRMAALALLAVTALAGALGRIGGRRVGTYAAIVLALTPAWFVHGRTATLSMLPLAGSALVFAGLAVALLDPAASVALRVLAGVCSIGGVLLGVSAHSLAVTAAPSAIAIGFVAWRLSPRRRTGFGTLAAGMLLAAVAIVSVAHGSDDVGARVLVGARSMTPQFPTFDRAIAPLAYGLLPWSPLVAVALGRRPRASSLHSATIIAAALALIFHVLMAMRSGSGVLVGVAPLAACVAFALLEIDRADEAGRGPPGILVPLVLVVLGALAAHDVKLEPDRVMAPFGAHGLTIPAAHLAAAAPAVRASTWLTTALAAIALMLPRAWLPVSRGLAVVLAGALGGLLVRVHAYPALLARLSPGVAMEAFGRIRRDGDVIGVLGVDRAESSTLASARSFGAPREAAGWLASEPPDAGRRFLAFGAAELPRLNAEFRAARHANVPILAGGDGLVLLAASSLLENERSESVLDRVVLTRPPSGLPHPVEAVVGAHLELLGWELVDERGGRIASTKRGSRLRFYVRMKENAPSLGSLCTFIHVDNSPTRFSAEHKTHPYPMSLWQGGDVIADEFEITLPPTFRTGAHPLFWGVGVLPCEDDRRLPITSGPNDGHHRVPAGALDVR